MLFALFEAIGAMIGLFIFSIVLWIVTKRFGRKRKVDPLYEVLFRQEDKS